ncbi:MAG: hypothetical protein ACE5FS_02610 [Paracoccaceae bacterium]
MTACKDSFVGAWDLVPELCQYQDGLPPQSGTYDISLNGEVAEFRLSWIDHDARPHELEFAGPVDGSVRPVNGVPSNEVSFNRVDERTLDSSAYHDGREITYERHRASDDGSLMVVVQVHRHPEGPSTRNFQVYRRRSA